MQDKPQRQLAAIMFMDIVGYSAMVQESEARALEFVRIHKELVEKHSKNHGGKVMNYYGDASLTMFDSAIEAVKCAKELQIAFHNEHHLPMRIGIHLGEVVFNDETIYGNGVNIASRLESMGVPGAVLISDAINTELENQDELNATMLGSYRFKNISKPMGVYALKDPLLVLPEPKDLKSNKSRNITQFNIKNFLLGSLLLTVMLFSNRIVKFFKPDNSKVQVERLSVPSFKNFTGVKEMDYIGDMAAHRITKELFEIDGTNVVDFQTENEMNQIQFASLSSHGIEFAKRAGAVNILEGSIQQISLDSLMFSVIIKKIETGNIVHSFPNVHFDKNNPVEGIQEISQFIHGYWQSKDKKLVSFPKLEAYKLYIKAKNNWSGDDSETERFLIEATQIDPDFIDAQSLLLALYYNTDERSKAIELIAQLRKRFDDLNIRERNMVQMKEAYYTGQNRLAFQYYKAELEQNPYDLFRNTGFMAISNEFVHNYDETKKAFDLIDIESLDISRCGYCEVRLRLGLAAALGKGNMKEASKLVNLIPEGYQIMRSTVLQFRFYGLNEDIDKIDEIVAEVLRDTTSSESRLVRYFAARELWITENEAESRKFAQQHLNDSSLKDHWTSEWAHYFLGNLRECKNMIQNRIEKHGSNYIIEDLSLLGVIEAQLGNESEALGLIENIQSQEETELGEIPYYQSRIYLHLGQKDKSLELLAKAIQEGAKFYSSNVFENDPAFVDIKNDPAFLEVIYQDTN
tara:strand:+ start:548 stop:2785 length:2238 start_codon:yes stop_codon:yes gene_type:complete